MRISRLLVATATVAALVGTASPAHAGNAKTIINHDLRPLLWQPRSTDCAGTAVDTDDVLTLPRVPDAWRGQGSLRVDTDGLAGALRRDRSYLGFSVQVRADSGSDPRAQWYVEIGDAVLTSTPVALERDTWAELRIEDATFSDGGSWTGSMADWIEAHGHRQWAAGVLTGGCLDSATVLVDGVRNSAWRTADLEPSRWVSAGQGRAPSWDEPKKYGLHPGDRIKLVAQARWHEVTTGTNTPIAKARMSLQVKTKKGWSTLATRRANADGKVRFGRTFTQPVTFRVSWGTPGNTRAVSQQVRYVKAYAG